MTDSALIEGMLALAVPLWIEKVIHYTPEHRNERLQVCSEVIASRGDEILYRAEKPGRTADAFNHLAEGLAMLCMAPGGVKAFGMRWEFKNGALAVWPDE